MGKTDELFFLNYIDFPFGVSIIIIGEKKMLFFDELNHSEPIKIYNKYAVYPKIEKLKNTFFSKQAKIT